MRCSACVGGALALLAAFSVSAQGSNRPISLGGPITVTATRTPLIADQEVAPVVVITAQQIQLSGAQSLPQVLQQYAGFDIVQNGGPGQPASLFLRGTNSNQTLVMINGVKINPANGAGAPLENIRLSDIERIEIVKGPRAALYGSDAIGGVINIITREANEGMHYGAHLGAGRYGTFDNGGHFGYGAGKSAFGVSADSYHTDGFPAVAGTNFDSGNTDRTWNAFGRTALAGVELGFKHWQSSGDTEYTTFSSSPPFALTPAAEHFDDQVTSANLAGRFVTGWRSDLNLSHMLDEIGQLQPDPFNPGQMPDVEHTEQNVIDWQNDFALGAHQLFTGGLYSEAQHVSAFLFGSGFDQTDHINAVYAEDDIHAGPHRLVLAARDTHDQAFGNHVTWNADYGFDFSDTTRLTAGAGSGFRAPSAEERFGFGGNPNLRPESSENLELGLRERLGAGATLTLDVFHTNLNNLIEFVVTPSDLAGQNENVNRARVRGLEATYKLTRRTWSWRTGVIFQQPEDLNTGTRLLRRAERTLTTSFDWHDDGTSLGLHLIATGRRTDLDFNTGRPVTDAGYVLSGVTLHRTLDKGFALSASLENLLDTHYETAAGYNTAGRSLFLRLEYHR